MDKTGQSVREQLEKKLEGQISSVHSEIQSTLRKVQELTDKSVTKREFDTQLQSELTQVKTAFNQKLTPLDACLDSKVEESVFTRKLQELAFKVERSEKNCDEKVKLCSTNSEKYCDNQLTFLSKRIDNELVKAQADTKSMISTTQQSQSRAAESFNSTAADVESQVKMLVQESDQNNAKKIE